MMDSEKFHNQFLRSIIPIGTVMVWPTADIPTYGRGVWLECNGQSFDRNRFPQLYETLGTTRVPDYQGMFLRGYGSQTVSDDKTRYYMNINGSDGISNDDVAVTNVVHSSSDTVGGIQHDTIRHAAGYFGHMQNAEIFNPVYGNSAIKGSIFHWWQSNNDPTAGASSFPKIQAPNGPDGVNDLALNGTVTSEGYSPDWYDALTKYKYTMSCSSSDDGDGGSSTSCELNEEEIHPTLDFNNAHSDWYIDLGISIPTSNEIRPVNVAVKFMIKAK